MVKLNIITVLLIVCGLCACSSKNFMAPITEGWQQPIAKQGLVTVQHDNESLYAVAWRYGHDYRVLAQLNHLQEPYRLHKGQQIYLVAPDKLIVSTSQSKTRSKQAVTLPPKPTAANKKSTQAHYRTVETLQPLPKSVADNKKTAPKHWVWPTSGKIWHRFGKHNKGIDIVGRLGQAVLASAAGKVVYRGDGLSGYGRLIIIKHNADYFSAYAHNQRLWVKEGDQVKAGQKIAEMGKSGAERVMLHFELRRAGRPVDPLGYLPRR